MFLQGEIATSDHVSLQSKVHHWSNLRLPKQQANDPREREWLSLPPTGMSGDSTNRNQIHASVPFRPLVIHVLKHVKANTISISVKTYRKQCFLFFFPCKYVGSVVLRFAEKSNSGTTSSSRNGLSKHWFPKGKCEQKFPKACPTTHIKIVNTWKWKT